MKVPFCGIQETHGTHCYTNVCEVCTDIANSYMKIHMPHLNMKLAGIRGDGK